MVAELKGKYPILLGKYAILDQQTRYIFEKYARKIFQTRA